MTLTADVATKFELGQAVSTIHRIGSTTERRALWDTCCSGRIIEVALRDAHAYYRVDVERVHWHPEYEVHDDGAAPAAVARLNSQALRTK